MPEQDLPAGMRMLWTLAARRLRLRPAEERIAALEAILEARPA